MLARLQGVLLEKRPPRLLVDVGGVGYELEAPLSTFAALPVEGERVTLHTHLVIREDAHLLYAFRARGERELFRALIRVNGVGPKVALALLSGLEPDELVRCVQAGDTATLTRVPGIGKKTAERLIVEMRDRLEEGLGQSLSVVPERGAAESVDAGATVRGVEAAEGALIALGYRPNEAARAVASVFEEGVGTEELIRRALRGMVVPR